MISAVRCDLTGRLIGCALFHVTGHIPASIDKLPWVPGGLVRIIRECLGQVAGAKLWQRTATAHGRRVHALERVLKRLRGSGAGSAKLLCVGHVMLVQVRRLFILSGRAVLRIATVI